MLKVLLLIFTSLINLSLAMGEASHFIPVTRFKAKLVPCETDSKTCTKGYFYCQSELLQKAIKYSFSSDTLDESMKKMNSDCNFYYAQNNTTIKNGSYDIHKLFSLNDISNAKRIKVTITLASESFGEANKKPELAIGLYKNINQCELNKKFQSRAFLHHYLMGRYEIPFKVISKDYSNGIQKVAAIIDIKDIKCTNAPLYAVVTYMRGGFNYMKKNRDSKCKNYAYLIEIQKL